MCDFCFMTQSCIPELNLADENDLRDAQRFRWLQSKIEDGLLTVVQTTPGMNKLWRKGDLLPNIDQALQVEDAIKKWANS